MPTCVSLLPPPPPVHPPLHPPERVPSRFRSRPRALPTSLSPLITRTLVALSGAAPRSTMRLALPIYLAALAFCVDSLTHITCVHVHVHAHVHVHVACACSMTTLLLLPARSPPPAQLPPRVSSAPARPALLLPCMPGAAPIAPSLRVTASQPAPRLRPLPWHAGLSAASAAARTTGLHIHTPGRQWRALV